MLPMSIRKYTPYLSIPVYLWVYASIHGVYNIGYQDMLPDTMTTVKFIGKVSTMGDKLIIVIPKDFHKQIGPLKGQQVKVVVEEAIS